MSQKGINMKKLLLISILLSLPVFAADVDQYGIPYCQTKQDYNCHIKDDFKDGYNWYQVREQRWTNNGTELKNFVVEMGFEFPYQSYEKLCYDFKVKTQEEIEQEYEEEIKEAQKQQQKYEQKPKFEQAIVIEGLRGPTRQDWANLNRMLLQNGTYSMWNFNTWQHLIPDMLFLGN